MKKVGDVCKEDEVFALKTNKVQIEVRILSTGNLLKIFVPNQRNNVVVGNVSISITEQKETKKEEIKQTVQKQEEQHHKRESMIKFRYRKRDEINREISRLQSIEIKQPVQQQTITPPSPIQPPQTLKAGVIYHNNLFTLPSEYNKVYDLDISDDDELISDEDSSSDNNTEPQKKPQAVGFLSNNGKFVSEDAYEKKKAELQDVLEKLKEEERIKLQVLEEVKKLKESLEKANNEINELKNNLTTPRSYGSNNSNNNIKKIISATTVKDFYKALCFSKTTRNSAAATFETTTTFEEQEFEIQ
ncbi:hypothetical protein ABK040_006617 [Willaertia magna]